ncbi:metallophosphoesterase family protein [Mucilaginibacter sp. UYCu711]|uniref:metallophosphoesterase family protein n=1 Tax=Mucilaginibacter sp. UYCu711 TaxID=3156339 RepID=UPI003D1963C5
MDASQQQQVKNFISSAHNAANKNLLSWDIFSTEWIFLLQSEAKLVVAINDAPEPPDHQPGDAEYGIFLYLINHELPVLLRPIVPLLRELGLPQSTITPEQYAALVSLLKTGAGIVTADGTMIAFTKYAVLDAGYLYAVLDYLRTRYSGYLPGLGLTIHPFQTDPATMPIESKEPLRIAVLGDWGTGEWKDADLAMCPSKLVSEAIKELSPHIVIHLGDVYYSGTPAEEKNKLNEMWTGGSKASFTLNSNHEMYDGANGYFATALNDPAFSSQGGTSYFAITYADWIVIGLDSAYYDKSTLYKSGTVSGEQLQFISDNVNKPENLQKRVIILTHHNPINYDASAINIRKDNGSLLNDMYLALGNRFPDYWYYGHLHNGIVYNKQKLAPLFSKYDGSVPNFRCMGHAGIPAGLAKGLKDNPAIDYYVQTKVDSQNSALSKRVLNGFALLTLKQGSVTEEVFEVSNASSGGGVSLKTGWHN